MLARTAITRIEGVSWWRGWLKTKEHALALPDFFSLTLLLTYRVKRFSDTDTLVQIAVGCEEKAYIEESLVCCRRGKDKGADRDRARVLWVGELR